jgi:putative membrane protein
MDLLLSWLILSVAVWVTAALLPGIHVKNFGSALLVAAVFGVLNFLLGWLFFTVLTIATLGLAWLFAFLTRWFINTVLLLLTASLMKDFKVDGFGWALLGALVMSVVGTGAQILLLQILG